MFAGNPSLMGSKYWCAGRRVCKGIGDVSMQKCLYKGGAIQFRDSTPITGSFGEPFECTCAVIDEGLHHDLNITCAL